MNEIINILISRDGLTLEEAKQQLIDFCEAMESGLKSGGSPWAWEEKFTSEFGLEPDYFEVIVFAMC